LHGDPARSGGVGTDKTMSLRGEPHTLASQPSKGLPALGGEENLRLFSKPNPPKIPMDNTSDQKTRNARPRPRKRKGRGTEHRIEDETPNRHPRNHQRPRTWNEESSGRAPEWFSPKAATQPRNDERQTASVVLAPEHGGEALPQSTSTATST
jgi:hypothetical protein